MSSGIADGLDHEDKVPVGGNITHGDGATKEYLGSESLHLDELSGCDVVEIGRAERQEGEQAVASGRGFVHDLEVLNALGHKRNYLGKL